jgi:hypothetical protein
LVKSENRGCYQNQTLSIKIAVISAKAAPDFDSDPGFEEPDRQALKVPSLPMLQGVPREIVSIRNVL